jgi:hypothetical protein
LLDVFRLDLTATKRQAGPQRLLWYLACFVNANIALRDRGSVSPTEADENVPKNSDPFPSVSEKLTHYPTRQSAVKCPNSGGKFATGY